MVNKKNEKVNLDYKGKVEAKLNKNKLQRCSICEKLNKGVHYHSENSCWFKTEVNKEDRKNQIKLINNSELECELQEKYQKTSSNAVNRYPYFY